MKTSSQAVAYVQNQRFPSEYAHSSYVAKVCEAIKKLGYTTFLLFPDKSQPKHFPYKDFWDYYQIKKGFFSLVKISVPEFKNLPKPMEIVYKHLLYQLTTWVFSFQAARFLAREKIDIVGTSDREIIAWLRFFRGYRPKIFYDVHAPSRTWYEKLLDQAILTRVDLFVSNCQYYADYFHKKGVGANRILVTPNGFDTQQYRELGNSKRAREKLKLPKNRFIVGFIGRFETKNMEKGIADLLKAASSLKKSIPITVLAVGGPDHLVKKYRKMSEDLELSKKEAIILPQVKPGEVPLFISAFDVATMLYPDNPYYRQQISPMKAIEYAAAGKPIVATNLPSIKQVLSNKTSFLIKPGDQRQLEQVLLSIAKNPRKAKEKGRQAQRFVQQFSWKKRQRKILARLG